MRLTHLALTVLTMALVVGCSSSEVADVAETTDQLSSALASTLPLVTEFEKSESEANPTGEPITPFEENLNFFTPPKMIIPLEAEEPEEIGGELPPLRLVGFVGTAGDKAMVEVDGEVQIVTAGKRVNGVEIVSVNSPNVQLRWGETELTLDFYQPSKTDRPTKSRTPTLAFSPGLANSGSRQTNQRSPANAATARPAPRPKVSLPSLPGLPKPAKAGDIDFPEFPQLGTRPPAP